MDSAPKPSDFLNYDALKARIFGLPVRSEGESRLITLTNTLALIGIRIRDGDDGAAPPQFREADPETTSKQLHEIEARTRNLAEKIENGGRTTRAREQLARRIDTLNASTVSMLSELPMVTANSQVLSMDWAYFRSRLPRDLSAGNAIEAPYLRLIADAAKRALQIEPPVQAVGRPPDNRAQIVADILAKAYLKLTGLEPTFTVVAGLAKEGEVRGPFLSFVRDVFEQLNINRDATVYASRAARALRAKGRRK